MSEKKLLPKLRFVDENEEWDSFKLGDVLDKKGYIRGPFGSALKRGEMKTEGIPVYEQQHAIYDNRLFRYYIDDNKFEELKRFQVIPNDLIVSCSGTIGKTSLIRENDEKGIISQALLILRSNSKIIEPKFLKYFLETNKGYNSLISSAGGSSQVNIAKKQIILDIPLVVPKLQTQHKIINFLDKISNKIELLEHKYEKYHDFKKYLMQQIFAQKLRFDKYNKDQKVIRLDTVISIINKRNKEDQNLPVLSISNKLGFISQSEQFEDREVASSDKKNYKIVNKGEFAYNPARINVGSIAQLKTYEKGIISPMYIVFKIDSTQLNPIFFENFLDSDYFRYEMMKRLEGSVRMILSAESLKNIKITVPPIEEQEKLSKVFSTFDKEIKITEYQIEKMQEFKKGLLQQMFVYIFILMHTILNFCANICCIKNFLKS